MTTAAEQFAIQLGRSSSRARRHLGALSSADKDDVLADAILRCWESRESFDPAHRSVDDWFAKTVCDVRSERHRKWRERGSTVSVGRLRELASTEDTALAVEAQNLLEQLNEELTDDERKIARDVALGFTLRHARSRNCERWC